MDAYETEPVYGWFAYSIFGQIPARHRNRNKLEGIEDDTEKGDNVWMSQVSPHRGHMMKDLRDP